MQEDEGSAVPSAVPVGEKASVQLLETNNSPSSCLNKLNDAISHLPAYQHLFVGDYAPSDRRERYLYVQELCRGLCRPCVLRTYSIGEPVGNYIPVCMAIARTCHP